MADIIHPNLPADLPTDWNTAQYVSPNGTEVGLSEKHGYNYLMRQLNDTQTALNTLAQQTGQAVAGLEEGEYNATATRTGTTVAITGPDGAKAVTFLAPADWTEGDGYTYNGQPLTLTDLNGEPVKNGWKQGAPVSLSISGNIGYFAAGASGNFLPLEGGTLTGPAVGAAGEIAMPQFRNVQYGTEALIPGVSPLPQGMLYITPEVGGAELTAQEILDKLKTVDGVGSGLDADLLDGKQASEFAVWNHTHPVATTSLNGFMSTADKSKLDKFGNGYVIAGQKKNTVVGNGATAMGYNVIASGDYSLAGGEETIADGKNSITFGIRSAAFNVNSVAIGWNNLVFSGRTITIDNEKTGTVETNTIFYKEGRPSSVSAAGGSVIISNGWILEPHKINTIDETLKKIVLRDTFTPDPLITTAYVTNGPSFLSNSFSFGEKNVITSNDSAAIGTGLEVELSNEIMVGKYNDPNLHGVFVVGIGDSDDARSNGFRVDSTGKTYAKGEHSTTGADYAEYFEWSDGNSEKQDRRGRFVALDGGKIKLADSVDDFILGIVSGRPAVVGNDYAEEWNGKFLADIYGTPILSTYEVPAEYDEEGNLTREAYTYEWFTINPDYDPDTHYEPREQRAEWSAVGLMGQLVVTDDGTCQLGGYCLPGVDGIATATEDKRGYRVMERKDTTHVLVYVHGRIVL